MVHIELGPIVQKLMDVINKRGVNISILMRPPYKSKGVVIELYKK